MMMQSLDPEYRQNRFRTAVTLSEGKKNVTLAILDNK